MGLEDWFRSLRPSAIRRAPFHDPSNWRMKIDRFQRLARVTHAREARNGFRGWEMIAVKPAAIFRRALSQLRNAIPL